MPRKKEPDPDRLPEEVTDLVEVPPTGNWTEKQARAITLMAAGYTQAETVRMTGIPQATASRLLESEPFVMAVKQERMELAGSLLPTMTYTMQLAQKLMVDALLGEKAPTDEQVLLAERLLGKTLWKSVALGAGAPG